MSAGIDREETVYSRASRWISYRGRNLELEARAVIISFMFFQRKCRCNAQIDGVQSRQMLVKTLREADWTAAGIRRVKSYDFLLDDT